MYDAEPRRRWGIVNVHILYNTDFGDVIEIKDDIGNGGYNKKESRSEEKQESCDVCTPGMMGV